MKTKKQVEHFLRKRKYKSEIDFKGISSYCKTEYNIKLHVPSSYSDDPNLSITLHLPTGLTKDLELEMQ